MKNNLSKLSLFNFYIFLVQNVLSTEDFNFNITEIEILNGNFLKDWKRWSTTNDGLIITADEFEYDKILNILNAKGKVEVKR